MQFFIPTSQIHKPLPNKITMLPKVCDYPADFSLNILPLHYFGSERGTCHVL